MKESNSHKMMLSPYPPWISFTPNFNRSLINTWTTTISSESTMWQTNKKESMFWRGLGSTLTLTTLWTTPGFQNLAITQWRLQETTERHSTTRHHLSCSAPTSSFQLRLHITPEAYTTFLLWWRVLEVLYLRSSWFSRCLWQSSTDSLSWVSSLGTCIFLKSLLRKTLPSSEKGCTIQL